ncbi:MAG: GGDEF domain-containing protein [Candidatus Thiodiazotropha sp.]
MMNIDNRAEIIEEVDIFEEYRDRSRVYLDAFLSIVLLPFILINLKSGELVFSFLLFLLFVQTLVNTISYIYKKIYIFPTLSTFSVGIILLIVGIANIGIHVTYWAYPLLIIYHFYTPRVIVKYSIPIIITGLALVTYMYHGQTLALRFLATLFLMYFFTSIMIKVIVEQQSKLNALAVRDPLTGAFNRNYMESSFRTAIDRAHRGNGTASLVYLDIDHFKSINDDYGHHAGDRVLIEMVSMVKNRIRKVDEIYRSGGEEFIILLADTGLKGALSFARNLREQIENHRFYSEIKVTVSMGVVEYEKSQDMEQWIKLADMQLYNAKNHGRNCVMPLVG